jgi:hypothetical protein
LLTQQPCQIAKTGTTEVLFLLCLVKSVLSFWRKEKQNNSGAVIFNGMVFSLFHSIFFLFSFLSFEMYLNLQVS